MPRTQSVPVVPELRVPQARVLRALMPSNVKSPPEDWPMITRGVMAVVVGCSPLSGTINRVLNGVKEGSSSTTPHQGIVGMGLVEVIELDVAGLTEVNYRITPLGILAIDQFFRSGKVLPPVNTGDTHVNKRYQQSEVG